ncbi:hypothetical protein [Chryseobacterium sp. SNU WT5]|nr:hypothetical protein [Chryseobacterium sp. SNU WT5]
MREILAIVEASLRFMAPLLYLSISKWVSEQICILMEVTQTVD